MILLSLVAAHTQAARAELYLACSLVGPGAQNFEYSFAFDPAKGALLWVKGSQELKISRNTPSQLWASHAGKFRDFPHDGTDFRLNRVTGAVEINYLHKPLPAEVADCKKQRSWGCSDPIVLTQYSESGRCAIVDRVIK
jgi:hypothetical protein